MVEAQAAYDAAEASLARAKAERDATVASDNASASMLRIPQAGAKLPDLAADIAAVTSKLIELQGKAAVPIVVQGRIEWVGLTDPHDWWRGEQPTAGKAAAGLSPCARGQEGGLSGIANPPAPWESGWTAPPPVDTSWQDAARKAAQAAESMAGKIESAFQALAKSISDSIGTAIGNAKKLYDLTGTGGKGTLEPGANGPFERLYRILNIAKNAGSGPDSAGYWMERNGKKEWVPPKQTQEFVKTEQVGQEEAKRIGGEFERGNLFAPGVFERIDWNALAQQTTQEQQASKTQEYAGQAVAALQAAGTEITPESVKAMVDQLAAADKDQIVPSLKDIQTAVATMDSSTGTYLSNVLKALNELPGKIAAAIPTPTPTPPPLGVGPPSVPAKGKNPPEYATGTSWHPGGLALVGELGPELVNLPRGSAVTPMPRKHGRRWRTGRGAPGRHRSQAGDEG